LSSMNSSIYPLANTPSISIFFIRLFTSFTSLSSARLFKYTTARLVFVLLPTLDTSTFRLGSGSVFLITATLFHMSSMKPSFVPLRVFSLSGSVTCLAFPPATSIMIIWSILFTSKITLPSNISFLARSLSVTAFIVPTLKQLSIILL